MGVSRRDFIMFVVGGVAGIHVTPLPWKLTDDIAIWTQNWPWVPVPPVGEFTTVKSVCMLCPGGCGIQVRRVDNRAVKIEGRIDYPVNPGGVCPVGMGGLQLLYDEDIRFTSPMKRVGPRGAGQFMDITWDEAFHLLSGRIAKLRQEGRPEALAAIDGNPGRSTISALIERFLAAVGSPNYVRIPTVEDTYWMANALLQGTEGPMAYDLENADYVLSFGSGLLEGWGSPGRVINAWGLWHADPVHRKAKIVQIESRASNTASKADQWVPARPGTEAALALGLAHVIIREGLYHKEFVDKYSFGFGDWHSADGKAHLGFKTLVLKKYSPHQVGEITGLDPKNIIALGKEFAKAKAPIAICGKGKGGLNGGLYEFMAIHCLNALVGNINRPGGVLVGKQLPLTPFPGVKGDAVSGEGLKKARLDLAGSLRYPFTQSLVSRFTEAILGAAESPVNTLLVFSANPVYTLPDGGKFRKALKKVPFIVSFSPFRDETSYMADLILPDHTFLEKFDDVVWPPGLQYPLYGLSRPVVEPIHNTRNTGDVILQLAGDIGEAVGSEFPWKDYKDVLKFRAKGLFDAGGGLVGYEGRPAWKRRKGVEGPKADYNSFENMWEKLTSGGLWYSPSQTYGGWEGTFKTPTGKFEFFSTQIELAVFDYSQKTSKKKALKDMGFARKGDMAFMPHYEPAEHDSDPKAYPLTMVPYEMINLANGWIPSPPFLKKSLLSNQLRKNESFAEINPRTAAKYRLREGDHAIVTSPAGKIQVRVTLFEGAMPGIIYMPLGFGHTAYDEFLRGKGVNPNDIIVTGEDPLSGHPVWWNTPVQLIKV